MRLLGVDIPDEKRVPIALTYIFGIGNNQAKVIIEKTRLDSEKRIKELTPEEVNRVKEYIEKNFVIEGDLRREITQNIKRKKNIKSYEGMRHIHGLPVRGQQTRTNQRTTKGNSRRTMGSGKRGAASKK